MIAEEAKMAATLQTSPEPTAQQLFSQWQAFDRAFKDPDQDMMKDDLDEIQELAQRVLEKAETEGVTLEALVPDPNERGRLEAEAERYRVDNEREEHGWPEDDQRP